MVISKDLFGILYLIDKFGVLKHRIRFQKIVLIGKLEFKYPFSFEYERYTFGPYSFQLQNFVDSLITDGLIEEVNYDYTLTSTGKIFLGLLKSKMDRSSTITIDELYSKYKNTSVSKLIRISKQLFNW